MARTSVKDLVPGMKLARPVVNNSGLVMIGEGTELTDHLIEKIRQLEVGSVYVHGSPKAMRPSEEVLADLERRFRNVESEPNMRLLKTAIANHIKSLYEEYGPEDSEG